MNQKQIEEKSLMGKEFDGKKVQLFWRFELFSFQTFFQDPKILCQKNLSRHPIIFKVSSKKCT